MNTKKRKKRTAKTKIVRHVRINDWMNRRPVLIDQKEIALGVTVSSCRHCPTCQSRVNDIKEVLARKPAVKHRWKCKDKTYWLVLPKPGRQDLIRHLKETLELARINCV